MANTTHARLGLSLQEPEKQSPEERVQNWEEVYQGFDLTRARIEAARCIHCPTTPCVSACPVHNDIPGALLRLEHGDVNGAAAIFRKTETNRQAELVRLLLSPPWWALRSGDGDH